MKKLLSCVKISVLKCPIQIALTLHLNLQHRLLVWINQGSKIWRRRKLPQTVERLKLRKISKTFREEVNPACASVSSSEKARVAFETVCKEMYQHVYLNADEYKNSEEMIQTNLEPPSKVPKTSKGYIDVYKYVLPSSRTILKYKHHQATRRNWCWCGSFSQHKSQQSNITWHHFIN